MRDYIFAVYLSRVNLQFQWICVDVFQTDAGWEEYFDYIFPDDESAQPNLKLLEKAKQWKLKKPQESDT